MSFTPAVEFSTPAMIEEVQVQKVSALLSYVIQRSPFYKDHFKEHRHVISNIRQLSDLAKLPVTTKDDLQRRNMDFLCVGRQDVVEYTCTSGTLGKPVTIALSSADVDRLAYNEAISFACAQGSAADVYQLMLTLDRQFMAGMAYYEGIRKLGAALVRTGPGLPAMQWETIERLKPTTIVGVPSFIVKLLMYAEDHGIDVAATSVKKIVCIGENIRTVDFQPTVLAEKILNTWPVRLFGTYASTEMQTAFTECEHGCGGHHHPELVVVEILDGHDKPVPDGEVGEVCITTLGVEAMPLIRYKTGDVARVYNSPCACGRNTKRLGPILGRKQQMLKLKGTTVYPPAIFEILNQQPGIQDYAIEAVTGSLGTDELKVYIHTPIAAAQQETLKRNIAARFQSNLRVVPEISFVSLQHIQEIMGQYRKVRRFVDARV